MNWIAITESLPELDEYVFVWEVDAIWTAQYCKDGTFRDDVSGILLDEVSHWMPQMNGPAGV